MISPLARAVYVLIKEKHVGVWEGDNDKENPSHCTCGLKFPSHETRRDHVLELVTEKIDG